MAPQYKLTYFNSRGLTEPIRLVLAYAGVEYEDFRIEREQWPTLKQTLPLPFGKVPILEWDGNVLSESRAISRFLAKEHGLAGKNNLEQAKADMLVDAVGDLFSALIAFHQETDETRKGTLKKKMDEETIPNALNNFQNILQKNGTGYFVGNAVTYADLTVAYFFQTLIAFSAKLLDQHPGLKTFNEMIANTPRIKLWLEKRPVTQY